MASQGFFSGSASAEKRRFAGEKDNNANFSGTKVEEVKVANINKYNEQTPSITYPKDDVRQYIKDSETKSYKSDEDKAKEVEKFYGLDPRGVTYTPRDESKYEGSVITSDLGLPSRILTTKEKILGNKPLGYREGDGLTINPINFDKGTAYGIGLQLDFKNKLGLSKDPLFGGSMYSNDPVTQAYVKAMQQSTADSLATEERLRKEKEEKEAYEKRLKGSEEWQAAYKKFEEERKNFVNEKMNQETSETESPTKDETPTIDKVFNFLEAVGKITYVGPDATNQESATEDTRKLATMPSMGISEEGRKEAEKNRLEKAKENAQTPNVFQKLGNLVGTTFNALTGTLPARGDTLQSQGINTSATTNIAQMRGVSDSVQKTRDAIARSNLRKSGLDRTIGGASSQANYGRASRGFGTGTHGRGMPSNPPGMRQQGVGVSANNLSRHKAGPSTSRGGVSRSTSRGQGGGPSSRSRGGTGTGGGSQGRGGRRGGSTGGSGASSKGGTGKGQSRSGGTTGRKASKASRSRTGRSRSQCDIRTKIDISPLINSNLVKDNLAEVAYFVQEINK